MDNDAIRQHMHEKWHFFVGQAMPDCAKDGGHATKIIEHPSYEPDERSRLIYQNHVPTNTGTAAYADVRGLFDAVLLYIQALRIAVILLAGDQQTFSRMLHLRRFDGAKMYAAIVPFVGDFHTSVHLLMTTHILWYVLPSTPNYLMHDFKAQ